MSSQRDLFGNFRDYTATISIANGETINATGIGEMLFTVWNGRGDRAPIWLQEVLYVPGLGPNNLVSVRCIQKAGAMVIFSGSKQEEVSISKDGEEIAITPIYRNSYLLPAKASKKGGPQLEVVTANEARNSAGTGTLLEWHDRLGHLGFDHIKELAKTQNKMQITGCLSNPTCEYCQVGKLTQKPNKSPATHRTTQPLELIHSDLAGHMANQSLGRAKYFLLIIDDFSRYTTIYTVKHKSEVIAHFRNYKSQVENQHNSKIKRFRSDWGGEYTSKEFSKLLAESGIVRE